MDLPPGQKMGTLSPINATLEEGTILAGRFIVEKLLGRGSSAAVYLCESLHNGGDKFALKVATASPAEEQQLFKLVAREAKIAERVRHKNVVTTYGAVTEPGVLALVMEYVEGCALADLMAAGHRFSIPAILHILTQLAEGLEAIHASDIVHRDLKPLNILITNSGDIKITDFGISKSLLTVDGTVSDGQIIGSIDYVSPEALEKATHDRRSDIYSWGVIAFELLCGTLPYLAENSFARMYSKLHHQAPPVLEFRKDCPPYLATLVSFALARHPENRPESAAVLLEHLRERRMFGSYALR